jgi:hypothetical protein
MDEFPYIPFINHVVDGQEEGQIIHVLTRADSDLMVEAELVELLARLRGRDEDLYDAVWRFVVTALWLSMEEGMEAMKA